MSNLRWIAFAVLALAVVGCASSPNQPCLMPGADAQGGGAAAAAATGGQNTSVTPDTGRVYGAPNPTSIYARGDLDSTTGDYATESRTAGTIANPKMWSGDTSASATVSATSSTERAVLKQLELLAIQSAGSEPGSEAWKAIMDRVDTLLAFQKAAGHDYREQVIRLIPYYERCVLIQTDNAGSSTGEQDAFDPENAKAIASGLPSLVKEAGKILNAEYEDAPSTFPPATAAPEASSPDVPPAGVAVPE